MTTKFKRVGVAYLAVVALMLGLLSAPATAHASADDAAPESSTRHRGNDNFRRAIPHSGPGWIHYGNNFGATKEPCERNHAGNRGGASVWWKWRSGHNRFVAIHTNRSNFDTLLAVYRGEFGLCNLRRVAADDDSGHGLRSRVTFYARRNVTYYIAVDGYNGALGNIGLGINRI